MNKADIIVFLWSFAAAALLGFGVLVWQIILSQLRFRAICENSGNMIVIGRALTGRGGEITDIELVGCNQEYARHLGATPRDICGRRIVRDFFDGCEPQWLDLVREVLTSHESRHLEFSYAPLGTRYTGSVFCLSRVRRRCCFVMDEVSVAHRHRNELIQSRKLMDTILDRSGIGMWQLNLQTGAISILKATFRLIADHDREEISAEEFIANVHPEDRAALRAIRRRLPDGSGAVPPVEYRLKDKGGEWRWFQAVAVKTECDAAGVPVSVIGVAYDIDALKRSQLEVERISRDLEINQRWLIYSLQQSRTGFCRWEIGSDRLYHSAGFWQSVGGIAPADAERYAVPGTMAELLEIIVPEDPAGFDAWRASVRSGAPEDSAFRCGIRFLPDVCLEVRTSTVERDRSGKATVVSAFIIDITAIRRNEEALLAATKAADDANRSKGRFLAVMSHEIRTPLNAIIGFGSIIKGADIPARLQSYADSIKCAGEMLLGLIDDLLDYAKIESAKMVLRPEPIDLREMLAELERMFALRVRAKQLYLKINCCDDLPLLKLDGKRMRQILVNLTGNAVKFTSEGGVVVSVASEPCAPPRGAADAARFLRLLISVRDTGEGIPEQDLDRIFDPFEQAGRDRAGYVEGSGLGLAICKNLIDLMGGAIAVESQLGAGSNFVVTLERVECVTPALKAGAEEERGAWPALSRPGADDAVPREVMARLYARFGDRLRELERGMHVPSAQTLVRDIDLWVKESGATQAACLADALRQAVEDFNVAELRRLARQFALHAGENGGQNGQ
jgi:signal transduction histidine kinase/PAS domain-containing protein